MELTLSSNMADDAIKFRGKCCELQQSQVPEDLIVRSSEKSADWD